MKTIARVATLGLAISGLTFAQAPASTQSPPAATPAQSGASASPATGSPAQGAIAPGTAITADLARGLDSKKAKEGDQVQAKVVQDVLSAGKVVLPRNSRLIGHVTEVKTGGKGQPSSLGIAFDKAVLKDGKEIPVHGLIQALAPPPRAPSTPGGGAFPSDDGGGAPMAPVGGYTPAGGMNNAPIGGAPAASAPVGGTAGTATGASNGVGTSTANDAGGESTPAQAGMTTSGRLTAGSRGVMGMPGLIIDTGASNATNGTVVTNQNRNVKLDGGTQLVLRVTAQ